MVRRVSPSQWNSMVRQMQSKQREAIRKHNRAVDDYNRQLKRAVDAHNQNVRDTKRAVDKYNREVRAHNTRVRNDRQRLATAVNRLNSQPRTSTRVTYTVKSSPVYQSYQRLERRAEQGAYSDQFNPVLDLAEREAANSAELETLLSQEPTDTDVEPQISADPKLLEKLIELGSDLGDRWHGALFSLSPRNPDAARHFCTSAREIFVRILDMSAPDSDIKDSGLCELTPDGRISRRSRIRYMLAQHSLSDDALESFVEDDVDNILELFRVFNEGAHGTAGKYGASQLSLIKTRVEDGLKFLTALR